MSEDLGERAVNLIGPNEALSTALAHTGPVVILDASARLIVDALRRERLVARHMRHGRDAAAALAWVEHTDEPNARRIAATRPRARAVLRWE